MRTANESGGRGHPPHRPAQRGRGSRTRSGSVGAPATPREVFLPGAIPPSKASGLATPLPCEIGEDRVKLVRLNSAECFEGHRLERPALESVCRGDAPEPQVCFAGDATGQLHPYGRERTVLSGAAFEVGQFGCDMGGIVSIGQACSMAFHRVLSWAACRSAVNARAVRLLIPGSVEDAAPAGGGGALRRGL